MSLGTQHVMKKEMYYLLGKAFESIRRVEEPYFNGKRT